VTPRSIGRAFLSAALAVLSVVTVALGPGLLGIFAVLVTAGGLVTYTLRLFGETAPSFPRPSLSLTWFRELARFAAEFVSWAIPKIPFLAPFAVFVGVTWPLASTSESIQFQQQASEIIPVLLIGYVIEAGAIRWQRRPVDWVLSLMTVLILIAGETYALVALARDTPEGADLIAGSMAAGVTAILIAAIQGATRPRDAPGDHEPAASPPHDPAGDAER
jgi:hypothetical protein